MVVIVILTRDADREIRAILNHPEAAIGTVIEHYSSKPAVGYNKASEGPMVKYKYEVNDPLFISTQSFEVFVPATNVSKNELYLEVYHTKHPEKSQILFNNPIYDSTDLRKYFDSLNILLKEVITENRVQ